MIDFSPVYTTGLIVHCKTLEDSIALFEEVRGAFPGPIFNIERYDELSLERFHERKKDKASYRFHAIGRVIEVNRASIDWYRVEPAFSEFQIIEYNTELVDYGIDFDDQIDILSLLEGGEAHA